MFINALSVIVGLFGTIALSGTMSFTEEKTAYTNSTTAFLLMVFSILILRYVYRHIRREDKRGIVCSAVYSFGLAFCLTAGKQLHTIENFSVGKPVVWLQMVVLAIFFCGPVLYMFQWLSGKAVIWQSGGREEREAPRKYFLLTWLVIFLCWIPVFLAFYPGAFVYDAQVEQVQVETRMFTTHHPLSHVLMLGGFVAFGHKFFDSYNIGIAIYTVVQMVILSGIFAYSVGYLRRFFSKGLCAGITLFYGLFPVIPMYAVCSAKDTLFNGFILLLLIQMLKLLETAFATKKTEEKNVLKTGDVIVFVLAATAAMLFRRNGVLAIGALLLVTGVLAVIKFGKEKFFMHFAWMLLLSIVLYGGINKTLAVVFDADDSENQEFLTVPIQQLTRTYWYEPEAFSEEDKELLLSYLSEEALATYDADLSDQVKSYFNNENYAKDPAAFLGLWFRIFTKKPATYLNAWLMTSYGYWYPDTVINVYGGQERFTFQYEESSYFGFETEPPGERDSKFPWLEEQYRRMSVELYQQNVPGISMLFSPGFLFWIFFGCLLACIYRKDYIWLLPMVSILLLWGTVIPGPTFLVRYVLILWFALPLILAAGYGQIVNKF